LVDEQAEEELPVARGEAGFEQALHLLELLARLHHLGLAGDMRLGVAVELVVGHRLDLPWAARRAAQHVERTRARDEPHVARERSTPRGIPAAQELAALVPERDED